MKVMGYFNWHIALFVNESRLFIKETAIGEERVSSRDSGKEYFVSTDQVKEVFPRFCIIMDDF